LAGLSLSNPSVINAASGLSINPTSVSKRVGELFPLEIRLETNETIVGLDLNISFDPNLIDITKVTPGSYFVNPQILTNSVDKNKGLIAYSVFSYPGKPGADSLVNLEVKLLSSEFVSTSITIEKSSVVSGSAGKKINATLGQTAVSPLKLDIPTQTSTKPSSTSSPGETTKLSPTPTASATQPTIFLVDQITPSAEKGGSKSNLLSKLASVLIVVGAGTILFVIFFWRKSKSLDAKE